MSSLIETKRLYAAALQERLTRRARAACEGSLVEFIKQAWPVLEPGMPYVHNWHIDAMAAHLEAISDGRVVDGMLFNRLLMNVPPGAMKSMLVSVFWPAHEWGPRNMPHLRVLSTSHDVKLSTRDAIKMRRLVTSEWYVANWGDRVKIVSDQNEKIKFENSAGGFRQAASASSVTGSRVDRFIIDDPISVVDSSSAAERAANEEWFLEAVPTRMVDPSRSAIVVIMQRLHEADISGVILDNDLGYVHLCLPMLLELPGCRTPIPWRAPWMRDLEPFEDPRTEDGELLFPARFPREVVERDAKAMGDFATAGQMQQRPVPRGGGVIQREYWQEWNRDAQREYDIKIDMFPPFEYIVASFDGAFTDKKANDYSALTVWGVWVARSLEQRLLGGGGTPRLMLMDAWRKKLTLHGRSSDLERQPGESSLEFLQRKQAGWGVVEHIAHTCEKYKVDQLIIENKASGYPVEQELRRMLTGARWTIRMFDPGHLSKYERVATTQPFFADGGIWRPFTDWSQLVVDEFASFPKGRHDDLVDSSVNAITMLRRMDLVSSVAEAARAHEEETLYRKPAAGRVYYES